VFRRFLRLRLHVSKKLQAHPADKQVVIGVHPHGIASDHRILMDGMLYDAFPGRQILTLSASVLFYIPVVRELALWTRCIDARKKVAAGALKRGHSIMVIPGGEHEQIRTKIGREEIYLAKRIGFVKLALETGADLVPSYAFGCVDLYDTYTFLHGPREWIRKTFGVCIPIYRGLIGFLPKRVPMNLVFGDPIEPSCAQPGAPTDEEINAAHAVYIAALRKLFDDQKAQFGYADRELVVT
jgi:2-acylglycerol O-acyltransferase 2